MLSAHSCLERLWQEGPKAREKNSIVVFEGMFER